MKRPSIDELVSRLSASEPPRDVLEAAGLLVLLGAEAQLGSLDVDIDLGIDDALEDDAVAAVALLDGSTDAIDELRRAFAARDAVELRRLGAEAMIGEPPDLTIEQEVALVAFDETLRPHLWRLTAFNAWRALEVAWVPATHRSRFWWWSDASFIDPRGAPHLDAVAELVARFPEVAARLDWLAATQLLLDAPDRTVVDLGAWIRMRSPPLAMAASTGAREQVLLEHPSFTLSLLPPDTLLIDLLEAAGAEPPYLQLGAVRISAEPVPDALERYRFDLSALGERTGRAELFVSVSSGALRLPLPPDGD